MLKRGMCLQYRQLLPPISWYANSCLFQAIDIIEIAILPCDDRPKTVLSLRRKTEHISPLPVKWSYNITTNEPIGFRSVGDSGNQWISKSTKVVPRKSEI